jgi:hypothetical protein
MHVSKLLCSLCFVVPPSSENLGHIVLGFVDLFICLPWPLNGWWSGLYVIYMFISCNKTFLWGLNVLFNLVIFTWISDLLLKHINLGHNFFMVEGSVFHRHISLM